MIHRETDYTERKWRQHVSTTAAQSKEHLLVARILSGSWHSSGRALGHQDPIKRRKAVLAVLAFTSW